QRRAILRDELRQAVDDLARRGGIGLVARLRRLPQRLRRLDRSVVDALGGRDARVGRADVVDDDLSERHVSDAVRRQTVRERDWGPAFAQGADEDANLLARQAAAQRDLLDLALAQLA